MIVSGQARVCLSAVFVLLLSSAALACDSSILELITGNSRQKEVSARILGIARQIQTSAAALKSYNHAAAKKLHYEVMEHWLYVVSQLSSLKLPESVPEDMFKSTLVRISQDLGAVRRQIETGEEDGVHETLEAAITRMSMIATWLEEKAHILDFLKMELAVYGVRPFLGDSTVMVDLLEKSEFFILAEKIRPTIPVVAMEALDESLRQYRIFQETVVADEGRVSVESRKILQKLVVEFAGFKHELLTAGYFLAD